MPIIKSVTLYSYEELPTEAAKKRARQWYIKVGEDRDETVEFVMREQIECAGIGDAKLLYSLGHRRGDGVCFEVVIALHRFVVTQRVLRRAVELRRRLDFIEIDKTGHDLVPVDLKVGDIIKVHICQDRTREIIRGDGGKPLVSIDVKGDFTILTTAGGEADNDDLETWKSLLLPDLNVLEDLLDDQVLLQVRISHAGRSHGYGSNSMEVEVENVGYGKKHADLALLKGRAEPDRVARETKVEAMICAVENAFNEWSKEVARLLERVSYAALDDLTSERTVDEFLSDSDHLFKRNGWRCDCFK